jgi:two-component system C4-dicarboxylate transport response regulator DctD
MRRGVLLVESEAGVRALLRIQFRLLGIPVRDAGSGHRGVETFAAHRDEVGAVVAGELGPPLDGAGLLDAIRAIDPAIPFFFFLGHSLPPEVLYRPGVDVFLKPGGTAGLCRAVSDLVTAGVAPV